MPPLETPISDRILSLGDSWGAIAEFLDWLQNERRLVICTFEDRLSYPMPASVNSDQLRAEFFDVNLVELEKERRAILQEERERFKER